MTIDQRKLQLLSDTLLYPAAVDFVTEVGHEHVPVNKQLHGLATYSRTRRDLSNYINNRRERDVDKTFYNALHMCMQKFDRQVRGEWQSLHQFWPATGTKEQERVAIDAWLSALAHEFIQHLVAEALRYAPKR